MAPVAASRIIESGQGVGRAAAERVVFERAPTRWGLWRDGPSTPSSRRRREIQFAYVLLAPALLLLGVVLAYPVGWEVWTSLTDLSPLKDGSADFVGLTNYRRLLADAEFWRAAFVTVVYAVVTSVAKLALGLGFALLLARPFRGRALVFLAIFLPWAYPAGVSVIGWYWTLGHLKYGVDSVFGGGAWAFVSVILKILHPSTSALTRLYPQCISGACCLPDPTSGASPGAPAAWGRRP